MPCRVKQSVLSCQYLFSGAWASIEGHRTLKDLEVLQVCILRIDIEFDPGHGNIEVDTIENLAEGGTGILCQFVDTGGAG
jgi:hypothetical protein